MPHVQCLMSDTRCAMSNAQCPMRNVRYPSETAVSNTTGSENVPMGGATEARTRISVAETRCAHADVIVSRL
jgi:hypothetical protein